jgi:ankyrin repeat protein
LAQPVTRNGIMISQGADLTKPFEGDTLLFFAVNKDMVEYLVSKGLNVNARNDIKRTPLHQAVLDGNYEAANALLDKGADPHMQDNYGNTPLHLLVSKRVSALDQNTIITQLLTHMLEKTTNLEIKNNLGNTPLAVAITAYNTKMVDQLLQKGARLPESIYTPGPNQVVMARSPLQYLMNIRAHVDAVDLIRLLNVLIVHGADVNETIADPVSGEQITLLHYLQKQPWTPSTSLIISLLKSRGAHV